MAGEADSVYEVIRWRAEVEEKKQRDKARGHMTADKRCVPPCSDTDG